MTVFIAVRLDGGNTHNNTRFLNSKMATTSMREAGALLFTVTVIAGSRTSMHLSPRQNSCLPDVQLVRLYYNVKPLHEVRLPCSHLIYTPPTALPQERDRTVQLCSHCHAEEAISVAAVEYIAAR